MDKTLWYRTVLALAVLLAVAHPGIAAAQTCMGHLPVTTARPFHGGAGLAFNSDVTLLSGSLLGGTDRFLGGVTLGRGSYDEVDIDGLNSTVLALFGALQLPATPDKKAMVCPMLSVSKEFGPNDIAGTGIDLSTVAFGGGASIGVIAAESGSMQVIPTAALQIFRARATLSYDGDSESVSDTQGSVKLGLGLAFSGRISVSPSLQIPFGVEGGKTSFSIDARFSFGGSTP